MTSYKKHLNVMMVFHDQLINNLEDHLIRNYITQFMKYLERSHLIDKFYLDHNRLFLSCEVNQSLIEKQTPEILFSFLTMIYRIDYIDPNSDAFMIYYKNKMLEKIVYQLIQKLKKYKELSHV